MISTQFEIIGAQTTAQVRRIRSALQDVEGIGAIAIELPEEGRARLIVKHKETIDVDRTAIEAALSRAGGYLLA